MYNAHAKISIKETACLICIYGDNTLLHCFRINCTKFEINLDSSNLPKLTDTKAYKEDGENARANRKPIRKYQ